MKEARFYLCKHCGNVVTKLADAETAVVCCGEAMDEMKANVSDGAQEKHLPVYTRNGATLDIQVGSVLHPMLEEHHIGFIWLQSKLGAQLKSFSPADAPTASFTLAPDDEAVAIYEWCNLHGLWKTDI